jgi:hypothetical protein
MVQSVFGQFEQAVHDLEANMHGRIVVPGLRREHVLVQIIASWDPSDADNSSVHQGWARDLCQALEPLSLPGGYPNFLGPDAQDQAAQAYGNNISRLQAVKHRFDPDGFFSATPLPARRAGAALPATGKLESSCFVLQQ